MSVPSITDVINGKDVVVNGVNQLGKIKVMREVVASPIFHSAGSGGAERAEGNIDFTGFYWAWGHTPATFPNASFALAFQLDDTTATGLSCADVLCTGIDILAPTYDPRAQNGVYHIVYFGARGTDFSAGTIYTDTTASEIKSSKGLYCKFGANPSSLTTELNVQDMKLSIRSTTERTVTSDTAGVYIRPTGNIDWQFTYRRAINKMSLLPALNTVGRLQMYVEAAKYWQLDYGRVLKPEVLLDHESSEPIAAEVTIEKAHADGVTGITDGSVGTITDPTPTQKWP